MAQGGVALFVQKSRTGVQVVMRLPGRDRVFAIDAGGAEDGFPEPFKGGIGCVSGEHGRGPGGGGAGDDGQLISWR